MIGYWGGAFPSGGTFTIPAVAASLLIGDVAPSGVLPFAQIRARVVGPSSLTVEFVGDYAYFEGALEEAGSALLVKFKAGETRVSDLFALINVGSAQFEIVGTSNPSDILTSADEFAETALTGGASARPGQTSGYWGGDFPEDDAATAPPPLVTPIGPATVATFALQLETGTRVTFSWSTDVFKSYSGLERRACILDDPRQTYEGPALLLGAETTTVRNQLARYAALGRPFSVGLPFEQTTLSDDATGAVLPVDTASLDWANPGQRVIVLGAGDVASEGVIQAVAANSITLDVAPAAAIAGSRVFPAMAVFFEPQQGFARYRTNADRWAVKARAALYGFPTAAIPAELALIGELTGLTLRCLTPGVGVTITIASDASGEPTVDVSGVDPLDVFVNFDDDVSTVGGFVAAVLATGRFAVLGDYTGTDVMTDACEMTDVPFTGNAPAADPVMGRGAALTMYGGRPIWDRRLDNDSTISDQVHTLTELVDLGGIPISIGDTTIPDWGRNIALTDTFASGEWQWAKAFLGTVKGRWKSFWLPTYRSDLTSVADATATTLTIATSSDDYDLWVAHGYRMLRVEQEDAVSYVLITASVDNGDGTTTLTVENETGAPLAGPVTLLSWLELCRLESDDVAVGFRGNLFALDLTARVIQESTDTAGSDWAADERSAEHSEPREGIEIKHGTIVHRVATGSRDVTINGNLYAAEPAQRDDLQVSFIGGSNAFQFRLPVSHAYCQRYLQVPPQQTSVTVLRKQVRSDVAEQTWYGTIMSGSVNGHVMTFTALSTLGRAAKRHLPVVNAGKNCPHVLYDTNCKVSRSGFVVTTTVSSFSANKITVASIGGHPTDWAKFGELLHIASGERMTITSQTGTLVILQLPIPELQDGDAVQVFAGDDHTMVTCREKFANKGNYGGAPSMPTDNPFIPGSKLGIISQA